MARRPTEEEWAEIKARYSAGFDNDSNMKIAGDYGISEAAIRFRAKKEGWTRNLRSQLAEIKQGIEIISTECSPQEAELANSYIKEILDIRTSQMSWIKKALKLCHKNMDDALNEPDPKLRIQMASLMKATIVDINNLANNRTKVIEQNKENNEEEETNIKIYLPQNTR